MPESFYIEPRSGARYPLDVPRWCSDERTPLLISPHGGLSREDINRSVRSLWRYRASLPVEIVNPITMGEGCTPVVQKPWGDFRPYFKLEWFNPTSSFKDRGTTVMLSFLRRSVRVGLWCCRRYARENPGPGVHFTSEGCPNARAWRGSPTRRRSPRRV